MPLTRCSSASWSTSGLAVLPGGRRCGSSGLALGGGLLAHGLRAGGVRGVALGRPVLGRSTLGRSALGGTALGGTALGGIVGLGSLATGGPVGRTGRLARLAPVGLGLGLAVGGPGATCLGLTALDLEILDGLGDRRGERFLLVRPRPGRLQGALGTGQ